jgi:hypothetical protein
MRQHLGGAELHFTYIPKFREYGIGYADGGNSMQLIAHCPWCGDALPKSLRIEWFDELDALKIDPYGELPLCYQTDEWWRTPDAQVTP